MKGRLLVAAAAVAALGFTAYALASGPDKALVYCPVGIDTAGCDNVVNALSGPNGPFPAGVDRGYDGTSGTIDLATADLGQYEVFVVPSLADGADGKPYELLRNRKVAYKLSAALRGRLAVWSGTPDQGTASRTEKDRLIRNLAVWARGDASAAERGGIVVLQDHSDDASTRYGWLDGFAGMKVSADGASEVYDTVRALTATGTEILDNGSGQQLTYAGMASFGLQSPAAATGAAVDARGGSSGGAVVLVTSPKRRATIQTDRADYSPGDTVVFTGSGWEPGETVNILLREDPIQHEDRTLTAVADADGNIVNKEYTPEEHDLGTTYYVTATGQSSALAAQTTFTDDNTITVTKKIDRDGDGKFESFAAEGEFQFCLNGTTQCAVTNAKGEVEFKKLKPGDYTITEEQKNFTQGTYNFVSGSGKKNCTFNGSTATATVGTGKEKDAECTFNNGVVKGTLIIEKQTDPDQAAGSFTFSSSTTSEISGSIGDGGKLTFSVKPGTHVVTEGDPTAQGFDLTAIGCSDQTAASGASTVDVPSRTATFNVQAGETVTCTFTNTKRGKIVVEKQTEPDGAAGNFTFTGAASGTISDNGTIEATVRPGTHTVTEGETAGFDLTAISCSDANSSGSVSTRTATFNVEAGETVTCTFTNVKRGEVLVRKQTEGEAAGAQQASFDFTFDGEAFTLSGGGEQRFEVKGGSPHTVEELREAGFDLTKLTCEETVEANSTTTVNTNTNGADGPAGTAELRVEAGERVTCTFTNTKRGKIVVEKQTDPDDAQGSFTFSGAASGTISDNGTIEAEVKPGTHTVTEGETAGFDLTAISCDDATSANVSTGDVAARQATFRVEAGETVRCTFTNTQRGKIVIEKQTDPDKAAGKFAFSVDGKAAGELADDGTVTVEVKPGTHTVAEADPTPQGFDLTAIDCGANGTGNLVAREATVAVAAGATVNCTFTNTKRGKIVVEKQTNPDKAAGSFTFTGAVSGTISDDGTLEAEVKPGVHTATEGETQGFDLTAINCTETRTANSSGNVTTHTATFNVEAGETVKCTFTNTQRGKVIIEKQTQPDGATGTFSFTFDNLPAGKPIGDNQQITIENVKPGNHTVTEENPGLAFELISIVCDAEIDESINTNGAGGTATIEVKAGATVKCTFTNRERSAGKVTGGGQITPINTSGRANFGFVAQRKALGDLNVLGSLEYQDHTTSLNVHSLQILWLVVSGNTASFGGTCTYKSPPLNTPTPCTFKVEVEDNGEPGKGKDKFGIQVFTNGYLQPPQLITRGNIQIHKQP